MGVLSAALFLLPACQKETETSSSQPGSESCAIQRSASDGDPIPGEYIVVFKRNTEDNGSSEQRTSDQSQALLRQHRIGASALKKAFAGEIRGFTARLSASQANELRADEDVQTVEQDRIIALNTCFTVAAPSLITWNIKKVGYGDGTGKTAWVIDSGIDMDHPDLKVDKTRSRSFLEGQTSADDENGHGTHVAGIIGALNNTTGVLGVASGASLVSLRVLDGEGVGKLSAIIQALSYINANARAGDVVNMSLGEEEISATLDQQVQLTASRGIFIAIAAGNDSKQANLFSPARVNAANIYTVSATDSLDNFASFSNYGNDVVDFAAPGVRILSTYKDGKYARMSGTSMAAPHLAGLLLLNGRDLHFSGTAKNDPDGTADRIVLK